MTDIYSVHASTGTGQALILQQQRRWNPGTSRCVAHYRKKSCLWTSFVAYFSDDGERGQKAFTWVQLCWHQTSAQQSAFKGFSKPQIIVLSFTTVYLVITSLNNKISSVPTLWGKEKKKKKSECVTLRILYALLMEVTLWLAWDPPSLHKWHTGRLQTSQYMFTFSISCSGHMRTCEIKEKT